MRVETLESQALQATALKNVWKHRLTVVDSEIVQRLR
jgi:hypothetical protein